MSVHTFKWGTREGAHRWPDRRVNGYTAATTAPREEIVVRGVRCKPLMGLVGRAGVEPATNGLKAGSEESGPLPIRHLRRLPPHESSMTHDNGVATKARLVTATPHSHRSRRLPCVVCRIGDRKFRSPDHHLVDLA